MIQAAFLGAANMVIQILIQKSQWPRGYRENHSCFHLLRMDHNLFVDQHLVRPTTGWWFRVAARCCED